jgi:hypothetical protein
MSDVGEWWVVSPIYRFALAREMPLTPPAARSTLKKLTSWGVFARLVAALVFKTSGGFEQSSLWVRFPYTPV